MDPDISIDNIPQELDDHFKNFGKYSSDVDIIDMDIAFIVIPE